jgi:hypothetical protein
MKLVVLITSQPEQGMIVAQAWQDSGAPGITVLGAHGLHNLQREIQRGNVELPRVVLSMSAALASLVQQTEHRSQIFLSLVDDALVEPLIAATENELGDLTKPDNGILFVIDVERALGVRYHRE